MDPEQLLPTLPDAPGCYLFRGEDGEVLYVGKANSIRKRVRSHFQRRPRAGFVGLAVNVEFIVTANEPEALLLEHNLIRDHQPRHNVRLKDDKKYPWIKITWQEQWPRVFLTRTVRRDGAKYFGPFPNVRPARELLQLIRSVFPIRSCRIPSAQLNLERPCLDYELKRCVGPCIGQVAEDDYRALILGIESVLRGNIEPVKRDLTARMETAAADMAFERAAFYRDAIENLAQLQERQAITRTDGTDSDTLGYGRFHDMVCVVVMRQRAGRVQGSEVYTLDGSSEATVPQALSAFMSQFYAMTTFQPQQLYVPELPEDVEALEQWLSAQQERRVSITAPQRGDRRQGVETACRNAELQAADRYRKLHGIGHNVDPAVAALADVLKLDEPPLRIECYDVSNLQGTHMVASMAVLWCGQPERKAYRHFRIRDVEGQDDVACLRETLTRRLARDGDETFGPLPDLLVIDGGLGQVRAVAEVLDEQGYGQLPLISLAKQEELVYHPERSKPLVLPRRHPALLLLQRVRDEAHRFAVRYHRNLRSNALRASVLDGIRGLGPQRKRQLLTEFGSVDAIRAQSPDDLARLRGISPELAQRILEHLHEQA